MKQQDHNTPRIIRKIGKTTYIANAYFNENATESIDAKLNECYAEMWRKEQFQRKNSKKGRRN